MYFVTDSVVVVGTASSRISVLIDRLDDDIVGSADEDLEIDEAKLELNGMLVLTCKTEVEERADVALACL